MINASDIWTVAWHEFLTNVRRRGFIIGTLLPPAFFLVVQLVILASTIFSAWSVVETFKPLANGLVTAPDAEKYGLIDQSNLFVSLPTEISEEFIIFQSEAAAKQALQTDEISMYFVIPGDYLETGIIKAYSRDENVYGQYDTVKQLVIKGLLAGKVDEAVITRINDPVHFDPVELDAEGNVASSGMDSLAALLDRPFSEVMQSRSALLKRAAGIVNIGFFGALLFMLIFAAGNYLFQSVSEEKESRIIEIMLSSISAHELLAGKIVGYTALTLTQVGVWLFSAVIFSGGLAAFVVGAAVGLNPQSFFLGAVYCLLGYVMYAIIMATLGAGVGKVREGNPFQVMFLMIPFLSAYPGCFLFAVPEASNSLFIRLLSLFPLTSPMIMMIRLAVGPVPVTDIIGSIVILIVINVFILWAGVKIFRASLLISGQRPSLKQLWYMVRTA